MRVLHLSSLYAPYSVGGAERVVEVLAEGAVARGLDVAVAHLAPTAQPVSCRNGVRVQPLSHRNPLWIETSANYPSPLRNLNKIATLFNVLTANDFDAILADYRPDIVHTHSMVELTPKMWQLAKQRGASVVHTLHDYDLLCIRASLFKGTEACAPRHLACSAFSRVKKYYHSHIDHVVGVSQSILDTHLEYGFFRDADPAKRHVIWNPVQPKRQHSVPVRPHNGPLTFGFLGRLVPEKGIHTLIEACRRMQTKDWRLRIAGRSPTGPEALEREAAGLPVEFVGFVDPQDFFRDIDVLVVPSIWLEPFGLTIVEAYAAGVPVIGSDLAGVSELVGTVDRSALVQAKDPDALARKMDECVAAGRQALPRVDCASLLQATSADHVVGRYLGIYELARPASPAEPSRAVSDAGRTRPSEAT